jgi:hypothetical protein
VQKDDWIARAGVNVRYLDAMDVNALARIGINGGNRSVTHRKHSFTRSQRYGLARG